MAGGAEVCVRGRPLQSRTYTCTVVHEEESCGGGSKPTAAGWLYWGSLLVARMHQSYTGSNCNRRKGVGLNQDQPNCNQAAVVVVRERNPLWYSPSSIA